MARLSPLFQAPFNFRGIPERFNLSSLPRAGSLVTSELHTASGTESASSEVRRSFFFPLWDNMKGEDDNAASWFISCCLWCRAEYESGIP